MRVRSVQANQAAEVAVTETRETTTTAQPDYPRAESGTIAEIESPATATSSASQTSTSAREQRYRELLGTAPATATTGAPGTASAAPPAPEPSMIEKGVRSIAEALGVRKPAPPAPASVNVARRPQPSHQGSATPEPKRDEPATKDPERDPNAERPDEDADVIAPRLLSLEFTPSQVQDGEQTVLIVNASDNLSGLRSVSGVIVSPSNAPQGFACQREGDTGRFTSRITVPKEAAEGDWTIKYLTIMDNASNNVQLTAQNGLPPTARFRVISSASDSAGPNLRRIWLDKPNMAAGEKNAVNIQADDDKSGVKLVSGVFVSPKKRARIGFGCKATSGDLFQCSLTPAACGDCGAWQLEQVQLQDNANNMTTLRADNVIVAPVNVELLGDACDDTPPLLQSLILDPLTVSNAAPSIVKVTAVASDDQCGVASLSGRVEPPKGTASSSLNFPLRPTGDGRTFVGEIPVPQHAANGLWTIVWIQAIDKGHNQKPYTQADPIVGQATFRVE